MGQFMEFSYEDFMYKLFVPSNYEKEKSRPLMVMLHGCKQDPDDFAAGTKMNEVAEKENFLVLYPAMNHLFDPFNPTDSNPDGCWNWFLDYNQHRGQGHAQLIKNMVDEVKSKFGIDSRQVYAVGLSAGAALANILGACYPDVFSGLGICSGIAYDAADVFIPADPTAEVAKYVMLQGVADPYRCGISAFNEMGEYKRRMPVIVFHGLCDTVVHPINGKQVIIQWLQTNLLITGAKGKANIVPSNIKSNITNERGYMQQIYNDKTGVPLIEFWMIDDMGHTWSGGNAKASFTDPLGPSASEMIWNFFLKQQKLNNAHSPD